jgi:histidinol-phosphatase (PHP family)
MLPDYHVHTVYCGHAEGDMRAYRDTARRRLVPELSFSCHAPSPDGYDARNRMEVSQFEEYGRRVAVLQAEPAPPLIRLGIEADYYEAGLPFLRRWLPDQPFDLVLGSVHYIGDWGFDAPENRKQWDSVDVAGVWRAYFELVGQLADTRLFDVLAHPDLPKKFGHRPPDRQVAEMVKPALDRIAAAGMALEINTSGLRKPVREIYPSPLILALARERNIPVCFGSDSHRPDEVGQDFPAALDLVRAAGYTHSRWFERRRSNDRPLPERYVFARSLADAERPKPDQGHR